MKKIIGLSCGRNNEFCEALLKEAAMGAEHPQRLTTGDGRLQCPW
jgi:hypothetical protein